MTLIRFFPMSNSRGWLLAATLAGALWLTSAPAQSVKPVTVNVGVSVIDIKTHVAHEQSVLSISGPDGYALTLHMPLEHEVFQVDLLAGAEPRRTQQGQDDGQGWSSLPPGTYYYEVVLFGSDKEVGRDQGVFEVGADGRAVQPAQPADERQSNAAPVSGLQRALGAVLDFLVPSAQAQVNFFDDIRINKAAPSLIFDSTASAGNNWQIQGNTATWFFRDLQNNNTVFSIFPGTGNANALNILGNGNVGIGTTAPGDKLHVQNGNVRMTNIGATWVLNPGSSGLWFNRVTPTPAATGAVKFQNTAPANSLVVAGSGIGIGLANPVRQLHLSGSNATFRMDRSADTAAFLLVRTTAGGTPLKTFVVGANAAGSNNGEFIINDLGTAVSGGGARRMTINNVGQAIFSGTVFAPNFVSTSSRRFKEDVAPLADALALARQLQGVRFVWKDSGRPALGLIAEDVAAVLPEVVEREADGRAAALNYPALVAVLVEAVKDQQAQFEAQVAKLATYRAEVAAQQARVARLESRLAEFETLEVRLNQLEGLWIEQEPQMAAMPKL